MQPAQNHLPQYPQVALPTSSATATITITPTYTITPTPTKTPSPTATRDIKPIKISTIGQGLLGEVVRSADGSLVAYMEGAGTENPVLHWLVHWLDATTAKEVGSAQIDYSFGLVGFSSDNHWLLADSTNGVYMIDISTGGVRNCCGGDIGFGQGHHFSIDSRYISFLGTDQSSGGPYHFVDVFDLETFSHTETELDRLNATESAGDVPYQDRHWNQSYPVLSPRNYHTMSVPAISPDNHWLAAGYHETHKNLLYFWDLQTGVIRFSIPHIAEINRVDFSPNGRYLASGGDDGVVRMFNPLTGKLDYMVTGFLDSITNLRFSADGSQIIVSISKQPDQVYNLATGEISPLATPQATLDPFLAAMHQQGYADSSSVLFSPDGHSLAIGGQSVQLWDLNSQSVTASLENPYGNLLGWAFSPHGDHLAGITQNGEVLVWDTSSGELILNLASQLLEPGQVLYAAGARSGGIGMGIGSGVFTGQGIAFSPDGRQLAFGSGNTIEIWNIASASKSIDLVQPIAPAYATRVSYSADGKHLYAVINRNRDAQVWDVQTGKLLNQLNLPPVNPNAFSATAMNGSLLSRNNYDDSGNCWVEVWNLETGEMLNLPTAARETEPLRFSPDGSLLIAISDKRLYFWETRDGRLIHSMPVGTSQLGLAISPDNATLAIGQDGKAQLWDITARAVTRLHRRISRPPLCHPHLRPGVAQIVLPPPLHPRLSPFQSPPCCLRMPSRLQMLLSYARQLFSAAAF